MIIGSCHGKPQAGAGTALCPKRPAQLPDSFGRLAGAVGSACVTGDDRAGAPVDLDPSTFNCQPHSEYGTAAMLLPISF